MALIDLHDQRCHKPPICTKCSTRKVQQNKVCLYCVELPTLGLQHGAQSALTEKSPALLSKHRRCLCTAGETRIGHWWRGFSLHTCGGRGMGQGVPDPKKLSAHMWQMVCILDFLSRHTHTHLCSCCTWKGDHEWWAKPQGQNCERLSSSRVDQGQDGDSGHLPPASEGRRYSTWVPVSQGHWSPSWPHRALLPTVMSWTVSPKFMLIS